MDIPKKIKEEEMFIIDASKSKDLDGKIVRFFLELGDGQYREGEVKTIDDLKFHCKYTKESLLGNETYIDEPFQIYLVLYDNKDGANYAMKTVMLRNRTGRN